MSRDLRALLAGVPCWDAAAEALFQEKRRVAAMDEGALGASISGGGPSVFAWFADRGAAERSAPSMQRAFGRAGFDSDVYISPVEGPKASVIA